MQRFFTHERFGRPQFLSGLLLLMFAVQVVWLVHSDLRDSDPDPQEQQRIEDGLRQWRGHGTTGTATGAHPNDVFAMRPEEFASAERSPLLSLVSSAPLLLWPERLRTPELAGIWRWLPRVPFLACGLLLGASLWYVARRLCTNLGGFIALILYCFSPAMVQASAVWHTEPSIVAAWGSFGAIFTAIAVAHTLYAPREVVLWNWRRIALLGISFALAFGSQFSMIVVAPLALLFLFYVAPVRRRAGLVIWIAGCAIAAILFAAFYSFHFGALRAGLQHAAWLAPSLQGFAIPGVYREAAAQLLRACPAFALLLPVALTAYAAWPRTRYFGNTAPLLVGVLFFALALAEPHASSTGFLLSAAPFLFVFVAGVVTDLAETRHRQLVLACLCGLLAAYALWDLHALALVHTVKNL
jgi:hypothetical protein